MGSSSVQGPLWGAQARTWAELAEVGQTPFYEAVFNVLKIDTRSRLLDVGCGAGLALQLAAGRGAASVTGLDASEGLLAIARERLPKSDLRHGDLEELPFADASFTAATSFNAVQYATDPQRALRELGRVTEPGAPIAVVTWGDPARSEMRDVLGAIGGLLPPPPPGAGGPFALSRPGALEELVESAGLIAGEGRQGADAVLLPGRADPVRAQLASGPAAPARQHAGERAVEDALTKVMTSYRQPDGTVRLDNVFRYLVATT